MDLQGKKVLVFGAGISGIGSCGLLEKEGAEVILYDGNDKKDAEAMKAQLGEGSKVRVVLGAFPEEEMESLDLVVMSPGVPTDLPVVLAMKEKGIPVWGEIELAYVCGKGDVLGITGTNGKTTTTSLLGEIMKNARDSVFVVGNIGTPYTNAAADTREDSVIVAELSSFQLESIHTFHPKVSAVLNITPDHLNRHHTMEAYIRAKMNIAKNQTPEDICVLNYEDDETRKMADEFQASVLFFSSKHKLEQGIYLDGEDIVYKPEKEKEGTVICKTGELQILRSSRPSRRRWTSLLAPTWSACSTSCPTATASSLPALWISLPRPAATRCPPSCWPRSRACLAAAGPARTRSALPSRAAGTPTAT